MGKPYTINITDGTGTSPILNGDYSVSATVTGYNNSSILPTSLTIVEGTNEYALKISAEGTLTLHVTDDGTSSGNPIVGAKFFRTDKNGTTYGSEFVTNENGIIELTNVPYDTSDSIKVYYKQISSDGEHEFDSSNKYTTLSTQTKTVEIINSNAVIRTITLQDNNYANLPIETGSITLN